jgi:ABC-type phosphate/phosphonate transport system substrate-binding protein
VTGWGFGIVQAQELEREGRGAFGELCDLLSEASGVTFHPVITTSYRELAESLDARDVGIAWMPPIPTIELATNGVATALAIPARHGTTTYHSALIVRRGGPRSVADLKGLRAAWVQRDSAAGYLVPRIHLAGQGIDVLHYFARELFVHGHGAVIDAVVNGEADVGATYCHVDGRSDPRTPPTTNPRASSPELRPGGSDPRPRVLRAPWTDEDGRAIRPIEVLTAFGPIPNDALVGSNELPASVRSAVTRWLFDPTPRARDLLQRLLGSGDFRVPSPAHYDPLRHMLRAAHARGHDGSPSSSKAGIRAARKL